MLENIEAVLFDLDGTLVDSMWVWKDVDIVYLGKYGYDVPDDMQDEIEGMSFTETAQYFKKRFNIPETIEEIKEEWNQLAWDFYGDKVPLKDGIEEFLMELKKKGIKTGVASSNSKELVVHVLEKRGILKYFDTIRTSCEAKKGKPAPDIYLLAASDLEVEPSKCLVFEDLPFGILAGKNAGMRVCTIFDNFSQPSIDKKRELADYYIDDYTAILEDKVERLA